MKTFTKILASQFKIKIFIPWFHSQTFIANQNFFTTRSLSSDAIQTIKNAYLEEEEDYNLIGVDWNEMASDNNYLRSAGSTRDVGRNIAQVINHMVSKHDANLKDFHIIGHSLGAHTGKLEIILQN